MPVSPPASEATLLNGIALACYWLAAASLLVWLAVFVMRIRRLRQQKREAAAEERLTGLVLDQLAGYQGEPTALTALAGWERRLLLRVLRNLIEQTKGQDQTQLVQLLQRTGFQEQAFRELARGPAALRQDAAEVLSFFTDEASLTALQSARNDPDRAVRQTAIRALLARDRVSSLREMLEQLDYSREDPPLALTEIFLRLPARLQPEAITLVADERLPTEWRRMLAISLGRRQVLDSFGVLISLWKSPAPRLRAAAWVALSELGDPRAGEFVAAGLADAVPDVRMAACRCAAKLGGPDVLPVLAGLLTDPEWWVRHEAAQALLEFGEEGRHRLEAHSRTVTEDDAGWQALHGREEVPHVS